MDRLPARGGTEMGSWLDPPEMGRRCSHQSDLKHNKEEVVT